MVREQPEALSTHAGHRQRLRDRFQKSGLEGFADYEIVELLLTLAIPRSEVKQPAEGTAPPPPPPPPPRPPGWVGEPTAPRRASSDGHGTECFRQRMRRARRR